MKLFDPLGIVGPFTIKAKILLQELWRCGYGWDEIIGEKAKAYWEAWLSGAKKLSSIRINRCYNDDERPVAEVQLHVFCDASELAYGAVAYLRFSYKGGGHKCSFVMSKSRLAPIKTLTMPRLELNAARTGARLSKMVVHEIGLPVERVQYWSDSTITIQYIQNKKHRMKIFVGNRITEIQNISLSVQWAHVDGLLNPADLLRRSVMNPEKLMSN